MGGPGSGRKKGSGGDSKKLKRAKGDLSYTRSKNPQTKEYKAILKRKKGLVKYLKKTGQ